MAENLRSRGGRPDMQRSAGAMRSANSRAKAQSSCLRCRHRRNLAHWPQGRLLSLREVAPFRRVSGTVASAMTCALARRLAPPLQASARIFTPKRAPARKFGRHSSTGAHFAHAETLPEAAIRHAAFERETRPSASQEARIDVRARRGAATVRYGSVGVLRDRPPRTEASPEKADAP